VTARQAMREARYAGMHATIAMLLNGVASSSQDASSRYASGSVEAAWVHSNVTGNICKIASTPQQQAGVQKWMEFARKMQATTILPMRVSIANPSVRYAPMAALKPDQSQAAVLSRIYASMPLSLLSPLVRLFKANMEYIEPLTGLARNPETLRNHGCDELTGEAFGFERGLMTIPYEVAPERVAPMFDTTHLLLKNACPRSIRGGAVPAHAPGGRNLFFDLGCSAYEESIQRFAQMYERRCIEFDRIFGWEYKTYDPREWWKNVPAVMGSRIHLYDIPVVADEDTSLRSYESIANVLAVINATVTPADFVALKLDIDTPKLEFRIVHKLLKRARVMHLIDELFFEYHFDIKREGLRNGWITGRRLNAKKPIATNVKQQFATSDGGTDTVDDAIKLMLNFRKAGVRSHFWI